ncbi:MAG: TonB-dependent receptor domain-containing protein [Leadbetterella sp.]
MKKIFTLVFTILLSNSFAQKYSIEGLIKDSKNQGVPFATVTLHKSADSSFVKAEVSTENGGFKIAGIISGTYFFRVSSVGFEKYESPKFGVVDKNLSIVDITLSEANNLKEVVVKGTKPLVEVLADKTVFNVQSSMAATGTDALELLRKAPGVILDNNENVVLEGKTGVRIFIDGKPSILQGADLNQYLKSLQASDIESIEVITQPSSKYDAAGNAGIINIKLKKDKRFGTNGSASIGYGYGVYGKLNTSLSLNNRSKKVNVFGTASNRLGNSFNTINLYREQLGFFYDSRNESKSSFNGTNVKVGADFYLNSKNTLGLILNTNFNVNDQIGQTRTPISKIGENIPQQVLIADNRTESDNSNVYFNSNYKYADTLGRELNLDFDYGQYRSERLTYQPNIYKNGTETVELSSRIFNMSSPTDIDLLSAKVDYEQKVGKGKATVGIKFSSVTTDNNLLFEDLIDGNPIKNLERSNDFTYNEIINAAYMNYNIKIKKINIQGGLRVEQTISEGKLKSINPKPTDNVKRNYTDLFPSAGLTYAANQKNSWGLTYSRRIERPNYQTLNPFEYQIDELTFQRGNPFLQPQYIQNIKFSHTYKYTLNTSISFSRVNDFFAQITDIDKTDSRKNFIMQRNIATEDVLNFSVSYPFNVTKWWSVFTNLGLNFQNYTSKDPQFKPLSTEVFNLYGQNTFSLSKTIKAEVSGWFASGGVWGGTYLIKPLGSLDLALQMPLFHKKVSTRLTFTDVFFTSPWRGGSQFGDLRIDGKGTWESRILRINLSYNFGNKQVKSSRQRKTGLDDAANRI